MIVEDFVEADTQVLAWLRAGSGIDLVVRPGTHGALSEPHISVNTINVSKSQNPAIEYTCTPSEVDGELDVIELCSINDYLLTYQVAFHNCHDHLGDAMKLDQYLQAGLYRQVADAVNLSFRNSSDLRPDQYIEGEAVHYVTRFDIDVAFRCQLCRPANAIESVQIAPCADLDLHEKLTIQRPTV